MLHGIHGIQTGCILPGCMESTAFNHTAWTTLHSICMHFTTLHVFHCIQSQCMDSTAFSDAAWNQLHSIGIHLATLHGMHCTTLLGSTVFQSGCMESHAFNGINCTSLHGIHCIQSCCMQSTAFTRAAFSQVATTAFDFCRVQSIHGLQ